MEANINSIRQRVVGSVLVIQNALGIINRTGQSTWVFHTLKHAS